MGLVVAVAFGLTAVAGCSDDEEKAAPDAAGACKDMCSKIGFVQSRVDVQPNETNCFCSGAGTVTAEACTDMCKAIGKGTGQPFRSGAAAVDDSCQCQ